MSGMFVVDGAPGTSRQSESYGSYYASFSEDICAGKGPGYTGPGGWTRRHHRLLRDAGDGTIGVLDHAGDLRIVRYDAAFDHPHTVGYSFPVERFELEICFTGRMEIIERHAGRGELSGGAVSVSPTRDTHGSVSFPAKERYRAISVSGSFDSLGVLLGTVGVTRFRQTVSGLGGDPGYLGETPATPDIRRVGEQLYDDVGVLLQAAGPTGVGEMLTVESRVTAVLASLLSVGESARAGAGDAATASSAAPHELAGVRSVPQLLWERRHDLPTVRDLAQLVRMSPKRLSTVHREVYGTTVMERHRRRCVQHACDLLTTTDWTIEHIAHDCGYATSSNFIYAFRLRRGCTPGEYRQNPDRQNRAPVVPRRS